MTIKEALQRYGAIVDGKWSSEAAWCTIISSHPALAWLNTAAKRPVSHIYCNKDMAPALETALNHVVSRGLSAQLKTFDGCYEVRGIRGQENRPSAHSFAGAIDINASTNELGTDGDISDELAACFMDAGFTWGKSFSRKDPMHFSFLGW